MMGPTSIFSNILFFLLVCISRAVAAAPTLSISPTTLTNSGDPVVISWTNVDSPSELDWVGIYSPPDSPNHHFIGYLFLSTSPTWQSGSGNFTLPLLNLRQPYQFRLFRWTESEIDPNKTDHDKNPLPRSKHLLAKSGLVRFENPGGPEQVHLAFADRPDQMLVSFVAGDGGERFVKYGEKEEMEGRVGTTVERYEREDMCDWPANHSVGWRDPGFIHHGVMTNLKKGTKYYYKVGSDSGGWSRTYSFISRDEDSDETIAFLFGDMGTATPYNTFIRTQDESVSTIKWILRDIEALGDKPAFISHIGDISYARGYSWIWDNFFNQIEPVASRVPYHVCIGNHEYDWPLQPWKPNWASYGVYGKDGGGECGVPYSLRFKMPGNSSVPTGTRAPPTRNLYYSFNVGSVHFVYMSTETNFLPGSEQYAFLKRDLEGVDRKKTPFVVVQGHRPMYTTSNEIRDTPIRDQMMKHLEPLFVRNEVTLALWGHVHRYERFCPLNNFTCGELKNGKQGGYPVHAVIGMAGQDWQPIWEPRPKHTDMPVFPQPERSLYRGGEFGYTRIVASKEKLTLSYVGNHDGEVHDMVEIMATGEAVSGTDHDAPSFSTTDKSVTSGSSGNSGGSTSSEVKSKGKEPILPQIVKGGSVLLLGAFVGYILGFISRAKKDSAKPSGNTWLPVKTTEEP